MVGRPTWAGKRIAVAATLLFYGVDARADDDPQPEVLQEAEPAAQPAPIVEPAPPPPVVPRAPDPEYRTGLFENLFTNILDSVSGFNLLWHGAAIGSTAVLSASGADDEVQRWFWRDNAILGGTVTQINFIGGWFTPAVIPAAIALTGLAVKDSKAASAGVTALQAVGINGLVIQLTKFLTGRPLPAEEGILNDDERIKRSRDGQEWFSFGGGGWWPGGVAWPSGHTSAHMALASSLVAFYRDEKWLPFVAYPLVAMMGLSMIEGDHHWLSDVVAGGLSGHAIGWTVGENMRRKYDAAHGIPTTAKARSFHLQPVVSRDTMMLTLSFDPYAR